MAISEEAKQELNMPPLRRVTVQFREDNDESPVRENGVLRSPELSDRQSSSSANWSVRPALSSLAGLFRNSPTNPFNRSAVNILTESARLLAEEMTMILNLTKRPYVTFERGCNVLKTCDVDKHFDTISHFILKYSLKIYGLPECPDKDLPLAVYFFIEEVFGVESCKLHLCVWCVEVDNRNVVGVVLDSRKVVEKILSQSSCLNGTEIKVEENKELKWILDGFCLYQPGFLQFE